MKLVKGALIGGAILFLWGMVSWMLIPWHSATLLKFTNECEVACTLQNNTPKSGVYMLPYHMGKKDCKNEKACDTKSKDEAACATSQECDNKDKEACENKSKEECDNNQSCQSMGEKGAYVFVAIRKYGCHPMGRSMATGILIQIAIATLFTWIMLKLKDQSFKSRVLYSLVFGLAVGITCALPNWNWMGFGKEYTLVCLADTVIGFLITGTVLAKIIKEN